MAYAPLDETMTDRINFPISDKWVGILHEIEAQEQRTREQSQKDYEDYMSDEYEEVLYVGGIEKQHQENVNAADSAIEKFGMLHTLMQRTGELLQQIVGARPEKH